jgi:hypothetical protein
MKKDPRLERYAKMSVFRIPDEVKNEVLEYKRKRARTERINKALATVATGTVVIVGVSLLVLGALALGALFFKYLTWNLGVVGLASALGATVHKISFATALGAVFLLTTLRSILTGKELVKSETSAKIGERVNRR